MLKMDMRSDDDNEQPEKEEHEATGADQPRVVVLEGVPMRVLEEVPIGVPFAEDRPLIERHRCPVLHSSLLCMFCENAAQESPQRAECIGDDDDYFLRNRESVDTFYHHADLDLPRKRQRHSNMGSEECKSITSRRDLFNDLPDELLLNIFRFIPGARDRASCASVCKRCLKLQSHMQRKDFHIKERQLDQCKLLPCTDDKKDELVDEGHSQEAPPGLVKHVFDDVRVERQPQWAIGDLSRSLEGKKATDLRLEAIAVGTGGRGGLGKLCIKGGGLAEVTDEGLLAIGYSCAALQSLVLWDCPNITNRSITVIGEGCRLLQKFEAVKCPWIGDSGVSSIAKNAIFLSILSLDECPLVGDASLHAVSKGCPELTHLNIRNCLLVGDEGLTAILQNCRKLQNLKLQGVQISDRVLMLVSWHCNALSNFCVSSLNSVTEDGFRSFCNFATVKGLQRLAITNCSSFNDSTLIAVGNAFKSLRQISLTKCEAISDQGLIGLVQIASSLETLNLERCKRITGISLTCALSSTTGKLKEIHIKACDGIQECNVTLPSQSFARDESVVRSIHFTDCGGAGDKCLSLLGRLCNHQLRDLDLTGLTRITDRSFLVVVKCGGCKFSTVNVTGCVKLTDVTVRAIAKNCGGTLRSFVMDGCRKVTDLGLAAIGKYCVSLEDLDVSQCGITDVGVQTVISKMGTTLISLNLSGCRGITNQVLRVIEEGCPNLKDLNLKGCKGLTRRGILQFSERMWMCDVLGM